jgi:hypothetical protein
MLTSRRIAGAILAALTMLLIEPRLASAQDADTKEVLSYALTEAGLAKYTEATKKLAALPGEGVDSCDDDDAEGASLDQMAGRLEAVPGVKAAIQSAGMTSREYVLFSMSLLQNALAAWAASEPGGTLPPGVSKANVDFLKKHDAELKQLEGLADENDCIDAEAEDEDDD